MLIPPDNFGVVEKGVYRCSKLEGDHLPFLETLNLKLLILLDVAKPPRTLKSFLMENKVNLYNLGGLKISNHPNTESTLDLILEKSGSRGSSNTQLDSGHNEIRTVLLNNDKKRKNDLWMIIEHNLILAAFEVLLDKSKHGVLLVDSTLALIGLLRKIQKWNFNSIVNEYRTFTGNSSKTSYNVEVFLECLQLELIPYEDSGKSSHDDGEITSKLISSRSNSHNNMQRYSMDEGLTTGDDEDALSMEDYEDDIDEDLLSGSPQIPANLLKLVEQRKIDNCSQSASPDSRKGSWVGSRNGSVDMIYSTTSRQRRTSSVETRYFQAKNNRFLDPNFNFSISPRRPSMETCLRQYKIDRTIGDETSRKNRPQHLYYQPTPHKKDDFGLIKCRIPPEENLADWFIRGRNFWEDRNEGHISIDPKSSKLHH